MVPKGLNAFGSFVHAAESAVSFLSFLRPEEGPKMVVFSTLSTKSQTFYTITCIF